MILGSADIDDRAGGKADIRHEILSVLTAPESRRHRDDAGNKRGWDQKWIVAGPAVDIRSWATATAQ
jgi:hypothetical protein